MKKTIVLEKFSGEDITISINLGESQGNSTRTALKISSISLLDEKDIEIIIFGDAEREGLGEILIEAGKHILQ